MVELSFPGKDSAPQALKDGYDVATYLCYALDELNHIMHFFDGVEEAPFRPELVRECQAWLSEHWQKKTISGKLQLILAPLAIGRNGKLFHVVGQNHSSCTDCLVGIWECVFAVVSLACKESLEPQERVPFISILRNWFREWKWFNVQKELETEFSLAVYAIQAFPLSAKKTRKTGRNSRPDVLAQAVALKVKNPSYTNTQIANEIGCNSKYLSQGNNTYKIACRALKAGSRPPRGSKDKYGTIEASDEE